MGFKKTEIEILLFLIDEIEKHFSKNKIFTQDGIVKGINEEITFKENRVPPATLKRFLNFKKKPNNISKDVIHKVAKWYTGGNFVSLEAFKNRNSKDFDDYIKSNEDFFNDFFKKFQKLKIKDVNENHEDEFDFKLEEVTKLNKEEALLDNLKKQGFEKKISKRRIIVFCLIGILVLFIVGLLYNKHTAPFNTVFHLSIKSNLKLHSDYPKLNDNKTDLLKFHLPANKIEEKEINNKSEVILNDLPYYLLGKVIKAELEDRFWKLSKDSIFFKKGTINLIVEPNETLSKIEGEVFTQIGGLPIENAIIHVEGLETKTNAFGVFTLTVPVEKRRIQYGLSIYKEGYKSYKKLYFSGEKAQIRLLNSPKKN